MTARHTIIILAALAFVAHLKPALASEDAGTWTCGGKRVESDGKWNEMTQYCNILKKGFCRYLCVLQRATVLDIHLELQEDEAQEVISNSVKDPDIRESIFKALTQCVKHTNDTDQHTEYCFGNQAFLHCLNSRVTQECAVDYDRFLYEPKLVPIPQPPRPRPPSPVFVPVPSPQKTGGGGLFGGLFGRK